MSRIGSKAVEIPDKVKVNIDQEGAVSVEGPKGKLLWRLPRQIRASVQDNRVSVVREAESRSVKALHGLSRSLVHNMVQGVSEGFTKQLEIEGVGFKAAVQGSALNLSLGFSHPVTFSIPKDIRRFYPPEPYKGKGVRYAGEQIRRKVGKTVQ
jgi:large subunit ribosomal protein L6